MKLTTHLHLVENVPVRAFMVSFIDPRTTLPFLNEVKLNLYVHVYSVSSGIKIVGVLEEMSASLDVQDFAVTAVPSTNLSFHKRVCDGVRCSFMVPLWQFVYQGRRLLI